MRISNNLLFYRSLNGITGLQETVDHYQRQIESGKRLTRAADDPVAAARVLNITERLGAIEQYGRNTDIADLRLSEQENAIGATMDALQRVRALTLQAKSRSMTTADRRFIAAEVRQRFDEVLQLANTRNASGEQIFAGTAVDTIPFARGAGGSVVYGGNQMVRELEIAEGRTMAEGYSGAEVFMAIRNGNGRFVTDLGAGNTGTGRLVNDAVTDITNFVPHDFRIVFTAADTFDVIDDTAGTTVLAAQAYSDGAAIAFNGSSVAVTGTPAAGDEFHIAPSANQSVFDTIQNAYEAMEVDLTSPALQARFAFALDRVLADIDQSLDGLNAVRASIGARQNALDSQRDTNETLNIQLETVKSKLESTDMVEAISQLARQTQALEAAQAAFVRVQGLSLFNFL